MRFHFPIGLLNQLMRPCLLTRGLFADSTLSPLPAFKNDTFLPLNQPLTTNKVRSTFVSPNFFTLHLHNNGCGFVQHHFYPAPR